MKEIWLIRHAESTANAGAVTSLPDRIPLTERGFEQAKYVAMALDRQPDLIVVSPFLRAQETAAPLFRRYPDSLTQEWEVQEFTYLATEHCRNTTYNDRKPLVAAYWERSEPEYCDGPGAESFAHFVLRAKGMIESIETDNSNFIVVFTHGQLIQLTMWLLWHNIEEVSNKSMAAFHSFLEAIEVPNASIIKLRFLSREAQLYFSGVITSHLPVGLINR
ncbi:MAG TPA: histidine phosphatase family protein [Pyrinomonadaceae bacterium]|nr:histidine phosphatase family protein [Pyrinomonadaceae bacterium]